MERIIKSVAKCNQSQLIKIIKTAGIAALEAGKLLRNLYDKPHEITYKGDIDLVTEADVAAEKAILTILRKEYPDVSILAEESHSQYSTIPTKPTWIIDPLDGTTNYAHGFPWFCVSIGYAIEGKTIAGVIYSPIQDELFCAGKGSGAWLNGKQLSVSETDTLKKSLVATGFPYDVHENPANVLRALELILTRSQDVRRAGAAALDLAYVASGRLDGFWEIKLKPWDTAAGQLLVEEAGGRVTDFSGGGYLPFIPEILATNGKIHARLADILGEFSETY